MNFKYIFGAILSIPFLPILYYQARQIRASVPTLPEAKGHEGQSIVHIKNPKSLQLVTIGESTIAGVGVDTHEEGFTGILAEELASLFQHNVSWKVYAQSGFTALSVQNEIVPYIRDERIDIFAIGLGANDAFTLNSPKKWSRDIRNLILNLKLKYPESIIVFCNMPPIKEFPALTSLMKLTIGNLVEMLGDELKRVVDDYENCFYYGEQITLEKWLKKFNIKGDKSDFFSDGVHPSKLTYQIWGMDIANCMFNEKGIREFVDQLS